MQENRRPQRDGAFIMLPITSLVGLLVVALGAVAPGSLGAAAAAAPATGTSSGGANAAAEDAAAGGDPGSSQSSAPPPLASVLLSISNADGSPATEDAMTLAAGQTALGAAFEFMKKHNVNGRELVSLSESLTRELLRAHPDASHPTELGVEVFPTYGEEHPHASLAEDLVHVGEFEEAAIHFALAAEFARAEISAATTVDEEKGEGGEAAVGEPEADAAAAAAAAKALNAAQKRVAQYHDSVTKLVVFLRALEEEEVDSAKLMADGNWLEALKFLAAAKAAGGPLLERSAFFTRQEALAHLALGNYSAANRKCGDVLRRLSHRGRWSAEQPRAQCVEVGARAALALGDVKAAKNFLSVALRADPDCYLAQNFSAVKVLDRGLKAVQKALDKGKNHDALAKIETAEGLLALMDVGEEGLMRAKLLVWACTAQGRMKRFEDAIESCEEAYTLFKSANLFTSAFAIVDVLKERANVYTLDNDHDEAARDYREILSIYEAEGVDKAKQNEARQQWRSAQQRETMWDNPARRDHKRVLDLPDNIMEVPAASRCKWVKNQHKAMVKKWHPDKAKGDKKRAARKFEEVSEAKKWLLKQWRC